MWYIGSSARAAATVPASTALDTRQPASLSVSAQATAQAAIEPNSQQSRAATAGTLASGANTRAANGG